MWYKKGRTYWQERMQVTGVCWKVHAHNRLCRETSPGRTLTPIHELIQRHQGVSIEIICGEPIDEDTHSGQPYVQSDHEISLVLIIQKWNMANVWKMQMYGNKANHCNHATLPRHSEWWRRRVKRKGHTEGFTQLLKSAQPEIKPSSFRRGGSDITPSSGGLKPKAVAGSPSLVAFGRTADQS